MTKWLLKRQDNDAVIELHPQLDWKDEYDWSDIAQSNPVRTLSGANIIQQGTKLAGRSITLSGQNAWMTRSTLEQLQSLTAIQELRLTLTHPDSRQFNVIFSRPAISNIKPIKPYRPADQRSDDKYRFDLHFITV